MPFFFIGNTSQFFHYHKYCLGHYQVILLVILYFLLKPAWDFKNAHVEQWVDKGLEMVCMCFAIMFYDFLRENDKNYYLKGLVDLYAMTLWNILSKIVKPPVFYAYKYIKLKYKYITTCIGNTI